MKLVALLCERRFAARSGGSLNLRKYLPWPKSRSEVRTRRAPGAPGSRVRTGWARARCMRSSFRACCDKGSLGTGKRRVTGMHLARAGFTRHEELSKMLGDKGHGDLVAGPRRALQYAHCILQPPCESPRRAELKDKRHSEGEQISLPCKEGDLAVARLAHKTYPSHRAGKLQRVSRRRASPAVTLPLHCLAILDYPDWTEAGSAKCYDKQYSSLPLWFACRCFLRCLRMSNLYIFRTNTMLNCDLGIRTSAQCKLSGMPREKKENCLTASGKSWKTFFPEYNWQLSQRMSEECGDCCCKAALQPQTTNKRASLIAVHHAKASLALADRQKPFTPCEKTTQMMVTPQWHWGQDPAKC